MSHETEVKQEDSKAPRECRWATMVDGISSTTCENRFEFSEGTPETNGFQFCPFCGGKISQSIVFNDGGEWKRAKERGFQ